MNISKLWNDLCKKNSSKNAPPCFLLNRQIHWDWEREQDLVGEDVQHHAEQQAQSLQPVTQPEAQSQYLHQKDGHDEDLVGELGHSEEIVGQEADL